MTLITNIEGRRKNQSESGYTRLFGDEGVGNLLSKVQGAVISAGTELEKIIESKSNVISDLNQFIDNFKNEIQNDAILLASKKTIKKSNIFKSNQPDFLIFDTKNLSCSIIELKDGDQFDTKKSEAERRSLQEFSTELSKNIPYKCKIYICAFNNNNKQDIYNGLKRKFKMEEILTGQELCKSLNIDYNEIKNMRKKDQNQNLDYFYQEVDILKNKSLSSNSKC